MRFFILNVKAAIDALEETKFELTMVIGTNGDKPAVFTLDNGEGFLFVDGFSVTKTITTSLERRVWSAAKSISEE